MEHVSTPIGREIIASTEDAVMDLTVDLADRVDIRREGCTAPCEPADKLLVRLRGDWRDAAGGPTLSYLESGTARQLAAALIRAADIADDLDYPRR